MARCLHCGWSLALLTLLSQSCTTKKVGASAGSTLQPVEVAAARAEARMAPSSFHATGSLAADDSADILPRVSERIVAIGVEVGQYVQQGGVLVQLDRTNLELRLRQTKAAEDQARASLMQAQSRLGLSGDADVSSFDVNQVPEVISARANLDTAKSQAALAAANATRYAEVLKTGDVSQTAHDQAAQQARAAADQARVAAEQHILAINGARQALQMITGARASLAGAHVQVAMAEHELDSASIRAPFSGWVASLPSGVGQVVMPSQKVATLMRIHPVEARLQVPESAQAEVRAGMRVTGKVAAYADREFAGAVTGVSPAIDPLTRTITVLAKIPNPDGVLRPGMFLSARVELGGSSEMIYVPEKAVLREPGSSATSVFLIENGKVRQKLVRLGEAAQGKVAVAEGLKAGVEVAVSNLNQLFDGAPVRVAGQ